MCQIIVERSVIIKLSVFIISRCLLSRIRKNHVYVLEWTQILFSNGGNQLFEYIDKQAERGLISGSSDHCASLADQLHNSTVGNFISSSILDRCNSGNHRSGCFSVRNRSWHNTDRKPDGIVPNKDKKTMGNNPG